MERLCGLTGMEQVFLCNSGTEPVEAALKFARLLTGRSRGRGGHARLSRAHHGGALGHLGKEIPRAVRTAGAGFSARRLQRPGSAEAAVNENTAAVILEVVQGEGGVRPGSPEFLLGAQELCRDSGALLIIDEVQTGFGRTGKLFAFQHYGLQPDLLCAGQIDGGRDADGGACCGRAVASC